MDINTKNVINWERTSKVNKQLGHKINQLRILESLQKRIQIEVRQNETEEQVLLLSLKKPIKRDPQSNEKEAMHMIKNRSKQLRQSMRDLEAQVHSIQQHMDIPQVLESEKGNFRAEYSDVANSLSEPPIVVGRSIANVFDTLWSNPEEAYRSIVLASKFTITHSNANKTIYKQLNNKKGNMDLWKKNSDRQNVKGEIELIETRLARSKEKISVLRDMDERNRINNAILQFHKASCQLEHVTADFEPNKIVNLRINESMSDIVLSVFVKNSRIDGRIGSRRVTSLLSEYMRATLSNSKRVNSGILFGVKSKCHHIDRRCAPLFGAGKTIDSRIEKSSKVGMECSQRYERNNLIQKIKHELESLKNNEKHSISKKDPQERKSGYHLESSKAAYLKRKHERYVTLFSEANAISNTCLVMVDEPFQGNLVVKDFQAKWNENGTDPKIIHNVQKANEGWDIVSAEISVEILGRNYFRFPKKWKKYNLKKVPRLKWLDKSYQVCGKKYTLRPFSFHNSILVCLTSKDSYVHHHVNVM